MPQLLELSEATAARRRVPVVLVDATDGVTAETGVTLSAGDMKISKAGGAEANHAGTLTELAGGDYYYEFTQGELDTVGYITGRIVKAGCRTFRIYAQVVAFDPYAALATQASVDTIDDFLDTEMAAIKAKTDNLPADPADASDIAASFTTVNTKLDTIDDFLDTEVAAIKAKTDSLTFTTANQLDVQVLSMATGVITASSIGADAFTAAKFAADVTTEFQSGLATAATQSSHTTALSAIQTKTDQLTFTVANELNVNARYIEGKQLSSKSGDNFDVFFHNAAADTTNTVDDVGSGGGGGGGDATLAKQTEIIELIQSRT